jgi:hypothetical protein
MLQGIRPEASLLTQQNITDLMWTIDSTLSEGSITALAQRLTSLEPCQSEVPQWRAVNRIAFSATSRVVGDTGEPRKQYTRVLGQSIHRLHLRCGSAFLQLISIIGTLGYSPWQANANVDVTFSYPPANAKVDLRLDYPPATPSQG